MSEFRRRLMMNKGSSSIPNYLCFTASEDNSTITRDGTYAANLEYSPNGNTWNIFDDTVTITLNTNDSVYFRGTNNRLATSTSDYTRFVMTGKIAASGNTMSLLYGDNFEGQLSLPNYTYTFYALFNNCFALTSAPELPATTLRNDCYRSMFKGCSGLIAAQSTLPALSVPARAYAGMFNGCSSLLIAPNILATTDAGGTYSECCSYMFYGCTSLTTASEFRFTNYYARSYQYMYAECANLVNAPSKIQITSVGYSLETFQRMFLNCKSLVTAPIITINGSVGQNVMASMFEECTNLANVQDVFPTANGGGAFNKTFYNCKNLTKAPTLPTLTLGAMYYNQMFRNASKLNYVKALFTSKSGYGPIGDWLNGVASTGIFVKHIDATWTDTGNSGVPTNWTIIYYDPTDDKYYTSQDKSQECDDHGNPL